MKLRIFSDLHIEFTDYHFEKLDDDKETICILAGDIGVPLNRPGEPSPLMAFLGRASEQFKRVLYVVGNHEYYHGWFPATRRHIAEDIEDAKFGNVILLEDAMHVEDNVAFIGATLWTYLNPIGAHHAMAYMNDFRIIKKQDGALVRRFRPEDANIVHETSKHFIKTAAQLAHENGQKVVVITHHGPSYQSVHARYKDSMMNDAFVSNLEPLIETIHPVLWIHGHVHDPFDYMVDETRVIANPRGYPQEQIRSRAEKRHDPLLAVEV